MIQRIQSIYLLILFIINIVGVVLNTYVIDVFQKAFKTINVLTVDVVFISIGVLSTILSFMTIFLYKKRQLQMRLCNLLLIVNFLFIAFIGVFVYHQLNLPGGFNYPEKGIEWIIALISIVFAILANSAIKSDDELVKSADRFR
jgi:hypothetical protein